MEKHEYDAIKDIKPNSAIDQIITMDILGLPEMFSGTIAVGYDKEGNYMHLYADYGYVTLIWSSGNKIIKHLEDEEVKFSDAIVDKRIIPEKTLFEYIKYLKENNIPQQITKFYEENKIEKGEFSKTLKKLFFYNIK